MFFILLIFSKNEHLIDLRRYKFKKKLVKIQFFLKLDHLFNYKLCSKLGSVEFDP